eukprot:TRINITY_DN43144_c0_g2_i1.p1 TRINITY_DN43144_c0_g2~~TRINITY_DN43144_c0_g2_i1.p1  ORF type:complete len:227 (+),score=58.96 TRINITY_DN43144_c0_g2_i1:134-814(+)
MCIRDSLGGAGARKYGGGALGRALYNALEAEDHVECRERAQSIGQQVAPKKKSTPRPVEHAQRAVHNHSTMPSKTSKRAVNVPKNFRSTRERPSFHPIDFVDKRKAEGKIAVQTNQYAEEPLPLWQPSLSSEDRKNQLQKKFEFHGQPKPRNAPLVSLPKKKDRRSEAQRLFDETEAEIAERTEFLEDMRAMGKGKEYEASIMAEIAERTRDLRTLHKHIESEQAQ